MRRAGSSSAQRVRRGEPPHASGIVLAATLHDPEGLLRDEIRRRMPALRRLYASVRVASSPTTAPAVRALLAAYDADAGAPSSHGRGPLYRRALRAALAAPGAARVHYLDFDRALHWAARRPRELGGLLRRARRRPAVVVGRTPRAHASHHAALVETEAVAARAFAARLGLRGRVDFLVPSFVLRRDLAARFLARTRARGPAMYGEWAALLVGLGVPLGYVECGGLDWETPDRFRDAVRRVGRAAWREAMSTPAEWAMRRAMARAFVRGCSRALRRRPAVHTRRRSRAGRTGSLTGVRIRAPALTPRRGPVRPPRRA